MRFDTLYDKLCKNLAATQRVITLNKAITAIGYISYPLLLVLLAIFNINLLATRIAVPAAAFCIVSIFRKLYNSPRPYEIDSSRPALNGKVTQGKSFPSRHTFCMFMISFAWISWIPWGITPGCALLICACSLALCRVALGVHYPRDVIAGALCAFIFSFIGYLLF